MASRLTTSAAHLTVTAEAQAIEDRLTTLAGGRAKRGPPRPRSTMRLPRSSPRSMRRWPRSASPTTNGRCSTASASRSNATCAPGRWPARRCSGPRHPASVESDHRGEGPPRGRRSRPGARPPTNGRQRRSTGWRGPRSASGSWSLRWRPALSASSSGVVSASDACGRGEPTGPTMPSRMRSPEARRLRCRPAGVAEQVDAADLKSAARKGVRVESRLRHQRSMGRPRTSVAVQERRPSVLRREWRSPVARRSPDATVLGATIATYCRTSSP